MANQHWTIDKRIPIAVIVAIISQTAAGIWWAATTDSRVSTLEDKAEQQQTYDTRIQSLERDMPVIREKIQNIEKTTDRIEKKLDKISANYPQHHSNIDSLVQLSLAELGQVAVS